MKTMAKIHFICVGFFLWFFTFLASRDLSLPGIQYDEASHACLTIDMLKPKNPFSLAYTLTLFEQPFPFGTDPHTGATKAYLFLPFFSLFGPSVGTQRAVTLLLGVLTLLFCTLFVRKAFGAWPALFTLLLLSTDTAFLFYAKLDAGPIIEKLMWMMVCLWSFLEWGSRRKFYFLLIGLCGTVIGIYGHIAFIWFVLASFTSLFLFYRREIRNLLGETGKKEKIAIGLATLLGIVVFFYWLIGARDLLALPVLNTPGVLANLERLATQAGIIRDVLGEYFQGSIRTRPPADLFFIAATVFLLARKPVRPVKFILVLIATLFLQMSFTPGAILSHRIMVLYIYFPMLAGISLKESFALFRSHRLESRFRRVFAVAVICLAVLSVSGQMLLTREVIRAIRDTGGSGPWSDEIYRLADYLKEKRKGVVCIDWGFRKNLFLLTKGEILLEEPFWKWENEQAMESDVSQMSHSPGSRLFLLHPEPYWVLGFPTVRQFEKIVARSGARAVLQKTFYEKKGKPVYLVYAIEPKK